MKVYKAYRIYSAEVKKQVLEEFKKGAGPKLASQKCGVSLYHAKRWFQFYKKGAYSWCRNDDKNYCLRQEALVLFKQGCGYKRVATELKISHTKAKYWLRQYKVGNFDFFRIGRNVTRKYSEEQKSQILQAFRESSDSKKMFCCKAQIGVCTLNAWLKEIENIQ